MPNSTRCSLFLYMPFTATIGPINYSNHNEKKNQIMLYINLFQLNSKSAHLFQLHAIQLIVSFSFIWFPSTSDLSHSDKRRKVNFNTNRNE